MEVGYSQTLESLFDRAHLWLHGSDDQVKMVILVDIQETNANLRNGGSWDLTDNQMINLPEWDLAQHIYQWHKEKGIPLLGSFKIDIYHCSMQAPRPSIPCWTWKFSFDQQICSLQEDEAGKFIDCNLFLNSSFQLELNGVQVDLPIPDLQEVVTHCLPRHEKSRSDELAHNKLRALNAAATESLLKEEEQSRINAQNMDRDARAERRQQR